MDLPEKAYDAWRKLEAGNRRFIENRVRNLEVNKAYFDELVKGQHPYATVLACSDSRVALERIFDVIPGEIFEIETAGNIIDDTALGSIEYGVGHLATPLLLVLGHTYCGAVTATAKGEGVEGYLKHIVEKIKPAVDVFRNYEGQELINAAIKKNVENVMNEIYEKSSIVREAVDNGNTALTGAIFEMENGNVKLYCMLKNGNISYF